MCCNIVNIFAVEAVVIVKIVDFVHIMGVKDVSYTVTPRQSVWGIDFRFIDDRGRVIVYEFLVTYEAFSDE